MLLVFLLLGRSLDVMSSVVTFVVCPFVSLRNHYHHQCHKIFANDVFHKGSVVRVYEKYNSKNSNNVIKMRKLFKQISLQRIMADSKWKDAQHHYEGIVKLIMSYHSKSVRKIITLKKKQVLMEKSEPPYCVVGSTKWYSPHEEKKYQYGPSSKN